MLIFLDFDDVLFNTREFRKEFRSLFLKFGISENQFNETYELSKEVGGKEKTYQFDRHLSYLENVLKLDIAELRCLIDEFLVSTSRYLFQDGIDFLKACVDSNISLELISFGSEDFQTRKVFSAGIEKYFKNIYAGNIVKGEVIKNRLKSKEYTDENDIYFVDDRVEYLEIAKKINPNLKIILMQRPEGRYADKRSKDCDCLVANFNEILKIINLKQKNV